MLNEATATSMLITTTVKDAAALPQAAPLCGCGDGAGAGVSPPDGAGAGDFFGGDGDGVGDFFGGDGDGVGDFFGGDGGVTAPAAYI